MFTSKSMAWVRETRTSRTGRFVPVAALAILLLPCVSIARASLVVTPPAPVLLPEDGRTGSAVFTISNDGLGATKNVILFQTDANGWPVGYTGAVYYGYKLTVGGVDPTDTANVTSVTSTINSITGNLDKTMTPAQTWTVTFNYTVENGVGEKDFNTGNLTIQLLVPYRFVGHDAGAPASGQTVITVRDLPEPATLTMVGTALPVLYLAGRRSRSHRRRRAAGVC